MVGHHSLVNECYPLKNGNANYFFSLWEKLLINRTEWFLCENVKMHKGLVIISLSSARGFECTFSITVNVGFIIQYIEKICKSHLFNSARHPYLRLNCLRKWDARMTLVRANVRTNRVWRRVWLLSTISYFNVWSDAGNDKIILFSGCGLAFLHRSVSGTGVCLLWNLARLSWFDLRAFNGITLAALRVTSLINSIAEFLYWPLKIFASPCWISNPSTNHLQQYFIINELVTASRLFHLRQFKVRLVFAPQEQREHAKQTPAGLSSSPLAYGLSWIILALEFAPHHVLNYILDHRSVPFSNEGTAVQTSPHKKWLILLKGA